MADRIQELRERLKQLSAETDRELRARLATNQTPYSLAEERQWVDASLPLLLDVAEAARELEQANAAMRRLLESGGYTGEEFDAIAERQHSALMDLRTALAALEGVGDA